VLLEISSSPILLRNRRIINIQGVARCANEIRINSREGIRILVITIVVVSIWYNDFRVFKSIRNLIRNLKG
jgi:hypothetical protein